MVLTWRSINSVDVGRRVVGVPLLTIIDLSAVTEGSSCVVDVIHCVTYNCIHCKTRQHCSTISDVDIIYCLMDDNSVRLGSMMTLVVVSVFYAVLFFSVLKNNRV